MRYSFLCILLIVCMLSCNKNNIKSDSNELNKEILNDSLYRICYKAPDHNVYLYYNTSGELIKISKEGSNLNFFSLTLNGNMIEEYLIKLDDSRGLKYKYNKGITESVREYGDLSNRLVNQHYTLESRIVDNSSICYKISENSTGKYDFYFNGIDEYNMVYAIIGKVDSAKLNIIEAFSDTIFINTNPVEFDFDSEEYEGLLSLVSYTDKGDMIREIYFKYPITSPLFEVSQIGSVPSGAN